MTTKKTTFLFPIFYKICKNNSFMENLSYDLGEEIISKLKELILVLERIIEDKNGKKC